MTVTSLFFETKEKNITHAQSFGPVRLSSQTLGCWGDAGENKQGHEFQKG